MDETTEREDVHPLDDEQTQPVQREPEPVAVRRGRGLGANRHFGSVVLSFVAVLGAYGALDYGFYRAAALTYPSGVAGGVDLPAGALVLGCDSVLELDGEALGKPGTPEEATRRWRSMRGRTAVLHSGHCLRDDSGRVAAATGSTTVHFADVSDAEVAAYVATGEPLQVAGAFTLDGLGGAFVRGVEGDPHTVVGIGLPLLRELCGELGRRAVRQGEEDHVVARQGLRGGRFHESIGQRHQVRLGITEATAHVGVPGHGPDLHLRMVEQQPEQLTARIPGGACHRYSRRHLHEYAIGSKVMQTLSAVAQPKGPIGA